MVKMFEFRFFLGRYMCICVEKGGEVMDVIKYVKPRVSDHPVGPFSKVDSNLELVNLLGTLCAKLRGQSITRDSRGMVELELQRLSVFVQQLPVANAPDRQDKINSAMQLITTTFDKTVFPYLSIVGRQVLSECLIKMWRRDKRDRSDSNYFSEAVFSHIKSATLG